jgi:hypothetical protein
MKNLLIALVVVVFAAVSCAPHRTCPTYMKDTKQKAIESKI